MEVQALRGISDYVGSSLQKGAAAKLGGDEEFSDVLSRIVSEFNTDQIAAEQAIQGLATGEVENLHEVVLAVAKADLAFQTLMEIRNRLIDAYQEVVRMQV